MIQNKKESKCVHRNGSIYHWSEYGHPNRKNKIFDKNKINDQNKNYRSKYKHIAMYKYIKNGYLKNRKTYIELFL